MFRKKTTYIEDLQRPVDRLVYTFYKDRSTGSYFPKTFPNEANQEKRKHTYKHQTHFDL